MNQNISSNTSIYSPSIAKWTLKINAGHVEKEADFSLLFFLILTDLSPSTQTGLCQLPTRSN